MSMERPKMRIIERIHNLETNEIEDIERDETAEEKANREALKAKDVEIAAERAAEAEERYAILRRLGLTQEEAKLLLG